MAANLVAGLFGREDSIVFLTGGAPTLYAHGIEAMWVTCYSDASFHPHTGGAWGVWLRSDRGRIRRQGLCPKYVVNANQAELAAIFAGLHLALTAWEGVRGINVRSDCQGALHWLAAGLPPARADATRRLQMKIRGLVETHGIELVPRWVRGHQRSSSVEAFLNNHCDRAAGTVRRSHGQQLRKAKKRRKRKKRRA